MEPSPIERAARALEEVTDKLDGNGPTEEYVRAVLEAIREPSEAMIDDGDRVHDFDDSGAPDAREFNRRNTGRIWQAMIDALLIQAR